MAIDNQNDGEVVDGATNLSKVGDSHVYMIKSYRQVKSPPGGSLLRHTPISLPRIHWQVYKVDQDSTEAACQEGNHEVDQMVTEVDYQR